MRRHRLRNGSYGFLLRRARVPDDRGRWRPVPAFGRASASQASLSGLDRETRESIREAYALRCTRLGFSWLNPYPLYRIAAYLVVALIFALTLPPGARNGSLIVLIVILFFDLISRRWLSWTDVMIVRDQMLAHGVCPHCAYPFGVIPPDTEGFIMCSECAAQWKVAQEKTSSTGFPPNS